MGCGFTVAAVCVILNCSAHKSDVVAAAERYSELAVNVPADAPLTDRKRAAELAALIRFAQQTAVLVWADGLNDPSTREGVSANFMSVQSDIVGCLKHFGHPLGLAESYRIQVRLLDAVDRERRIADDYGNLRPCSTIPLSSLREFFVQTYRDLAEGSAPDDSAFSDVRPLPVSTPDK